MKIKELIKLLKKQPQEQEILVCGRSDLLFKESDYNHFFHIIPKDLKRAIFTTKIHPRKGRLS